MLRAGVAVDRARPLCKAIMDISGVFDQSVTQSVADAIRNAADATGTSFQYLLSTAQAESGLNPQAAATTSSARGLYQFVDQTWLTAMKRSGPSLGYGLYADAIVQTAGGRYEVPDAAMRREIMALRDDPAANAALAGALTRNNAAWLAGRLGRQPTDGELYIAHVLGAAGAARLTALAFASPGTPADLVFPNAAEANRAIFYDRQGHPRSVSDVYGLLAGRQGASRIPAPASVNLTAVGAPLILPSAPRSPNAAEPAVGVSFARAVSNSSSTGGRIATGGMVPAGRGNVTASAGEPLFAGLFSDQGQPESQFMEDASAPRPPTANAPASLASGASLVAASGSRQMFRAPPAIGPFGR
jgi:hypothetical protein